MVKFNKYNLVLTIKRLIGIAAAMILGYLAFNFGIKLVFYFLYVGTSLIDALFASLV